MRVSVIIPAYNAERTIGETLASAQQQTHRDLEIFVVDDGSTDATAALAEKAAEDDDRVRVIRQQNAGVAAARNAGLRRATGAYVAWLDADDLWSPMKIEKQLAVFNASAEPLSFVFTGYRLIDDDGCIRRNFRTLVDISGHTFYRQLATHHFSNASSIMVPRELALRFGGHDPRLRNWGVEGAEDMLFQLRLASTGAAGCCREALVGYRMHQRNMSLDYRRAAQSNLRAITLIGETARDIPRWVAKLARARTSGYALHMLRDGDLSGAAGLLAQLFGRQPGYTALTLFLILRWQATAGFARKKLDDPDVNKRFADADPASAPWNRHMALSGRHYRRLVALDRERRKRGEGARAPLEATKHADADRAAAG